MPRGLWRGTLGWEREETRAQCGRQEGGQEGEDIKPRPGWSWGAELAKVTEVDIVVCGPGEPIGCEKVLVTGCRPQSSRHPTVFYMIPRSLQP